MFDNSKLKTVCKVYHCHGNIYKNIYTRWQNRKIWKKMFYTCEKMIYLKKSKLKYMALIIKPIYTYQKLYKNNTTKYL
jgi:hypothetical protein